MESIMKKLLKILATGVALVLFVFLASNRLQAQPRGQHGPETPPDSAQIFKMVDELAKAVSLSEHQKANVLKLHFEHFTHPKADMEKGRVNHEDMRRLHDEMKAKFEKQINALLDKKQKVKYTKYLKQQQLMNQQRERRPRR